jgi:hypothetical protein
MAVRAKADDKALDGMRVAGDAPDILALGVLASHVDVRPVVAGVIENPGVRNVAAACLTDGETCGRVAAILRNPGTLQLFAALADNVELRARLHALISDPAFLGLCSSIQQDTQLRQAAETTQANPKIAAIAVELATSAPDVLENLATAIKRPEIFELGKRASVSREVRCAVELAIASPPATELGHQILSLKGARAKFALKIIELLVAKRGTRASQIDHSARPMSEGR